MQPRLMNITRPETGETEQVIITEEQAYGGGRKPRVRFSSGYAVTFESGLRRMAQDRNITGTMHRVMAALLLTAPVTGEAFPSDKTGISKIVHMHEQTVANTFGALVTQGLLTRPRYGYLAFNPRYFWRGPAELRENRLAEQIGSTIISEATPA